MSSSLESRRVFTDPRFKLKNILDAQAQQLAEQINPDDLSFLEQAVSSYSRQLYFDEGLNSAFNGNINAIFYTPFEPDFQYLTLHLYMDNTGNTVRDYSGFAQKAKIGGNPGLSDAINISNGYGTMPALNFDGKTTWIDVISTTSISPASYNTTLGFTIFCYIRPTDLTLGQGGVRRTIAAKSDNSSYGFVLMIDTNGDLLFHVKANGVEVKTKAVATIHVNTTYQIIATFDASTTPDTATLTINNTNFTTVSTATLAYPPTTTGNMDTALHIGRADNVDIPAGGGYDSQGYDSTGFDIANLSDIIYPYGRGAFAGQLFDFRMYFRPLTVAERTNLWVNKQTIYDAALGTVALAGYSVANP
jgi:hypothetical protein